MRVRLVAIFALLTAAFVAPAHAQSPSAVPTVSVPVGWAAFVDDGRIDHGAFGVGAEWRITRHLAIGPELLYMVGPDDDRDLFVLGVVRAGILPLDKPVVPYVVAGGGLMRHSDRFLNESFSSTEGAFIFGGGARLNLSPRVFVAPEFTIGWEPHLRASVSVGFRLD